jgi:Arc/MetJ-type ribon-helix-helix transcriptional regulator
MKQKLSITIDEDKIKLLEKVLEKERFRSKSHVIEYSLDKFLNESLKEAKSSAQDEQEAD